MKKYSLYIVTLIAGLALGWLLFGGSGGSDKDHEIHTEYTGKWTCSMDPQVDLPEFGSCPICGMDLIKKDMSEDGLAANQFKMTENALALANVETVIIGNSEQALANNTLVLSGKILANDKATAIQAAHFGGRIEKLYYQSQGEFVKKGALIATIYSPELVTAQNELIEALNIKDMQPELYKAVRGKLKYWKISEEQIQGIEQTKKAITNFNLYANTTGYIENLFVEEGNYVKKGAPLFKVTSLASVWASLDVYEQDIKNLRIGLPITINLNAYPNTKIQTKINYINPMLNTATRTVSVRATLANRKGLLKPGMLLSGEVQLTSKKANTSILSVPKSAVLWTGKRSIVYVKISEDTPIFELREINLGNVLGANYIVLSGLEQGEEIVANGTFTIDAAAQLQGKRSMMNLKKGKTITGQDDKAIQDGETSTVEKRLVVSSDFQKQLKIVVDDYILLKNNLVNDNAEDSQENAKELLKNLAKVDMKLLKDDAHIQWMSLEKELANTINTIANSSEIEIQRKNFKPFSVSIISAVNTFGIGQKIYAQFCPMADDFKGATWLSTEEAVKNPYFGASMLSCGNVTNTIE